MLVDSHCHLNLLDLTPYQGELTNALKAAREAGVSHILCISVELETFPAVLKIAENYPDVSASLGVHPTEIIAQEPTIETLIKLAEHPSVIAIGETGLDYYREGFNEALQQERFRRHIRAAKKLNKPLIVHTRNARTDTLRILKEEGAEEVSGVLHCFTEDWEMAKQAIEQNFYISFSGIITFHNAEALKIIAKQVPLDRLLIETDAPYLAPVPMRGKPNQPAYVRYVAEYIATLRGLSLEEVANQTTQNFFRLFHKKVLS